MQYSSRRAQHGVPTVKRIRADVAVVVQPLAATPAVVHASNPAARVTMVSPTRALAPSTAVPREAAIAAHAHVRIDNATTVASISDLLEFREQDPNATEAQTRRTRQT